MADQPKTYTRVEIKVHGAVQFPCIAYLDGTTTHSGEAPLFTASGAWMQMEIHEAPGGTASYDKESDTYTIALYDALDQPSIAKGEQHVIDGMEMTLYRIGYDQAWSWEWVESFMPMSKRD